MSRNYLFKAKTREGFVVKILAEYFSFSMKFPPLHITPQGIFLRSMDQAKDQLFNLELQKENFTLFKCPKPLYFLLNSAHLYRLLKTIKKKDAVTLFITEQAPMKLGICVEQNDENSDKVTTYITINYIQPEEMELPDGYDHSVTVTSKHFQKLKVLQSIGTEMKVNIAGQLIKFYVNGKNLYAREISLGEETEETEVDPNQVEYCQTFTTQFITQLTKCAGQSGNIQIFYDDELPLQIKIRTGTLGSLTVYIKSKELSELLASMAEPEEGTVNDKDDSSDEEDAKNDAKEDDENEENGEENVEDEEDAE